MINRRDFIKGISVIMGSLFIGIPFKSSCNATELAFNKLYREDYAGFLHTKDSKVNYTELVRLSNEYVLKNRYPIYSKVFVGGVKATNFYSGNQKLTALPSGFLKIQVASNKFIPEYISNNKEDYIFLNSFSSEVANKISQFISFNKYPNSTTSFTAIPFLFNNVISRLNKRKLDSSKLNDKVILTTDLTKQQVEMYILDKLNYNILVM